MLSRGNGSLYWSVFDSTSIANLSFGKFCARTNFLHLKIATIATRITRPLRDCLSSISINVMSSMLAASLSTRTARQCPSFQGLFSLSPYTFPAITPHTSYPPHPNAYPPLVGPNILIFWPIYFNLHFPFCFYLFAWPFITSTYLTFVCVWEW